MEPTQEQWRPVVGYEGLYAVSDQGRVRSLDHTVVRSDGKVIQVKGRLRKLFPQHHGHLKLMLLRDGGHQGFHVHVLVLTAFVGPPPEGMQCRHLDGNPANNWLGNLAWGTSSENKWDQVRHGTDGQASKTHCKWGHPFDEENTYHYVTAAGGPARHCKECNRRRLREQRKKAREARWLNESPSVVA